MSFRPFEPLLDDAPNLGLLYTLFSGAILVQAILVAGAGYLMLRASRAHQLSKGGSGEGAKQAQNLMFVCAATLLGLAIALIDTETSIYFLPFGETNWSIALGYLGFSAPLFLLLPTTLVHAKNQPVASGTALPLVIVSVLVFVIGLGLNSVFWFHPNPIWAVRVTSFAWSATSVFIVAGISIYRDTMSENNGRGFIPMTRCILTIYFLLHTVVFYSLESPYPLLMRFLELVGLTGLGAVAFWTSLALDVTLDQPVSLLRAETKHWS